MSTTRLLIYVVPMLVAGLLGSMISPAAAMLCGGLALIAVGIDLYATSRRMQAEAAAQDGEC